MNKENKSTLKAIITIPAVIIVIFVALFAYSGIWPPLVVVDSESMQHGDQSSIGTIDTGDIVIIKETNSFEDITTYAEGLSTGHKTYSGYGDVIVYNSEYLNKSIIHRAIIKLEYDELTNSFSAPSLKDINENLWEADGGHSYSNLKDEIVLKNVPYTKDGEIKINLKNILYDMGSSPHSGIVTMGDGNTRVDQNSGISDLVEEKDITGKARGEIPWFGIVNLIANGHGLSSVPQNSKTDFVIALILIIGVPIGRSEIIDYRKKKKD